LVFRLKLEISKNDKIAFLLLLNFLTKWISNELCTMNRTGDLNQRFEVKFKWNFLKNRQKYFFSYCFLCRFECIGEWHKIIWNRHLTEKNELKLNSFYWIRLILPEISNFKVGIFLTKFVHFVYYRLKCFFFVYINELTINKSNINKIKISYFTSTMQWNTKNDRFTLHI